VACQEWNDLPPETTVQMGTYQTLPDLTPNFWNLIKFDEVPVDARRLPVPMASPTDGGAVMMLMRKDMCMHCAEPGCMIACPAEGAIVQYTNGIVDFQQEHCIGCGYCMTGCPFNIPKFDEKSQRVFKCTMCSDRVGNGLGPACVKACPTGCLEFGQKKEMQRHAEHRVEQVKGDGFANAGVYDPPGVGGTGVVEDVLHAGAGPGARADHAVHDAVTVAAALEGDGPFGARAALQLVERQLERSARVAIDGELPACRVEHGRVVVRHEKRVVDRRLPGGRPQVDAERVLAGQLEVARALGREGVRDVLEGHERAARIELPCPVSRNAFTAFLEGPRVLRNEREAGSGEHDLLKCGATGQGVHVFSPITNTMT